MTQEQAKPDEATRLCGTTGCGHRRHDHPEGAEWGGTCRIYLCACVNFKETSEYAD